ncbi:Scr1 family TA system antitoxin-like transcriptional regulator [Streptomyces sp. NPDC047987]|uniref:Scr1 family TA system antitoxin-like transcriptional regulator n=1 Tax=unclassified Streptomyces TaxID=2593676 RepID=UPI003430E4F5
MSGRGNAGTGAGRGRESRTGLRPFRAGAFHGAGQSILYTEGPVGQLDTVQLDTSFGGHFIDAPTPLGNYRSLLDLMEGSALPPDESRDLIRSIAREL